MRQLWNNLTVVEGTLPKLQKVGDELAATAGDRWPDASRTFRFIEISLDEFETDSEAQNRPKIDNHNKSNPSS